MAGATWHAADTYSRFHDNVYEKRLRRPVASVARVAVLRARPIHAAIRAAAAVSAFLSVSAPHVLVVGPARAGPRDIANQHGTPTRRQVDQSGEPLPRCPAAIFSRRAREVSDIVLLHPITA